jgi:hypothetical protein
VSAIKCDVCNLDPERGGECPSWKCPKDSIATRDDTMGLIERGFRFIVRGDDATWRKPHDRKPGDVDVTEIEDEEDLAEIFTRERDKASPHETSPSVDAKEMKP